MVVYNFKKIQVVPSAKDFIDIILSKTQRKTPTVVHKSYAIARIRQFYMRKVKYTQQNCHDKLSHVLEEFPLLDDMHPFYADLLNVLYDKDHYKLALGQVNNGRRLIDNVAKDYVRLLKYGDSLYRCKQLKRAALGRICTLLKRLGSSLAYLEHVRQHLARLPSIDPNARTIIVTGYPNVGKSSFMNTLTRANVDVQPYAFTTQSLFVGHFDYQYLRWQLIDTPGLLDHPLEDRNMIEMQSITALAHLRASVLYIVDISEQCGYSLAQQLALFASIRPLFTGKPLTLALNKSDVVRFEDLPAASQKSIQDAAKEAGAELASMSTLKEDGLSHVRQVACDRLLEQRVEGKLKGKKSDDVLARLHLAQPKPRDTKARPAAIPPSVLAEREASAKMVEEDEEDGPLRRGIDKAHHLSGVTARRVPHGEAHPPEEWRYHDDPLYGFNSVAWKEKYLLKHPDWRFDIIPEIMDGKNIADFVDEEIMQRLDELEAEEEELERKHAAQTEEDDYDSLDDEEKATLTKLRTKKKLLAQEHEFNRVNNRAPVSRAKTLDRPKEKFETHLRELGIENASTIATRVAERSRSRSRGRKRTRDSMDTTEEAPVADSRSRSQSGFRDAKQQKHAANLDIKSQTLANRAARKGPGDRTILNLKPKHLFSGKRGNGTNDRR